jgi:pimeloyl-ACP methyl ester carboxylesterase
MGTSEKTVSTRPAEIAASESSGKGLPIVFLHGNSMSKEVFRGLMSGPLGEKHRLIALDLPGHGKSSNAHYPAETYTMAGYADCVVEVMQAMGIQQAAFYGWSLGGHVALELMARWPGTVGAMISGTPPVGVTPEAIQAGFQPIPQIGLAGKPDFSEDDVALFAMATCGAAADESVRQMIRRTDGQARQIMFASLLAGQASDQKRIVETSPVPVAVVNGANDPLVNLDYVGGLNYANL